MKRKTEERGGRFLSDQFLETFAVGLRADFRFAPLNVLVLVVVFPIGLVVHLGRHGFTIEQVGLDSMARR